MRKGMGTTGLGALALAVLAGAVAAPPAARAQFFWDQPRLSPDDVARGIQERGFRPIHRPFRNDQVYVADVIDRRGRQERLIVSADSGEIVQRFLVEGTRSVRRDADPTIEPGPVPPGRIPNEESQPNLFSRLFGGDAQDKGEQQQDQPSQFAPNYALPPPVRPRPKRVPRAVVERAPETVPAPAPVESAPLAPASPSAPPPGGAAPQPPAQAALPPSTPAPPTAPASAPAPSGHVNKDPLAIPGSREDDDRNGKPAAFAVARPAPKPAAAPAASAPAPAPAAPKPPEVKSVPVAPLD